MTASSPWAPSFEPFFLAVAVVAAVAYVRAARTDPPGALRLAALALGLLLLAAPLNSPLETLAARYLLLAHLGQNALIADWAPPLLILGLTPAMRAAIARAGGRAFALATRPKVALPAWVAGWYGVHLPFFYDWALREGWPLNLEHAILIAVGFCFWWPLLEPEPRRLSTPAALVYLGAGFVASPWLALAYIFSAHPFYEFYADAPRLWGLSATKDQNLGGILMQSEQTLVFFAAIVYFLVKLADEEEERQRIRDAQVLARLNEDTQPADGRRGGPRRQALS